MGDVHKVLNLESPFRWRPIIRPENRYEQDLEVEEEGEFSFFNYCSKIVDVFYEYLKNDFLKASKILDNIEEKLNSLRQCKDQLFIKCEEALYHILYASKAILAECSGEDEKEVLKILEKVKSVEMKPNSKAAVHAIKACAYAFYNIDGISTSLNQMNLALMNDSNFPFWYFLKGTFLQRQRQTKNLNEVPSLEERELFDKALKLDDRNPLFMVYLADTYRDGCNLAKKRKNSYFWYITQSIQIDVEEEMNKKYANAAELYRKSYAMKPNCPVIAFKCANGLMRLPQKYQDEKLLKEILTTSAAKFPDSGFGNFVLAIYYDKFMKKKDLAQKHLARCVELNVFRGWMNMVRLDFQEKKENFNALEMLEKMLTIFEEPLNQEIIISQIVSYHVFVDKNIEKACEFMLKFYKKGNQGSSLEIHQSCFVKTNCPISLVDVVTDEVKLMMKNHKVSPEKRSFFIQFVEQMNFHNVEVLKGTPKNLLEMIQKSINEKKKLGQSGIRNSSSGTKVNKTYGAARNERENVFKKAESKQYALKKSASDNRPGRSDFKGRPSTTDLNSKDKFKYDASLNDRFSSTGVRLSSQQPVVKDKMPEEHDMKMFFDICKNTDRADLHNMRRQFGKCAIRKNHDNSDESDDEAVCKQTTKNKGKDYLHEPGPGKDSQGKRNEKCRSPADRSSYSSLDRSNDESFRRKKYSPRRSSSSSSSDSDSSNERRHRYTKHKRDHHRRRRSRSSSRRRERRRSYEEKSHKSHRKHSEDRKRHHHKHSRPKDKYSSDRHSDRYYDNGSSRRKGDREL